MNKPSDSWKNSSVFNRQLELNLKEISSKSKYPSHWIDFIDLVNKVSPKSMLDVGCGCGTFYKLCDIEFNNIKYVGIDYSQEAIHLAINQWKYNNFYVMDYKQLTEEYISDFELLHLGGMLGVLQNADDALDFLFSLRPKNMIIGRMKTTNKPSYYKTYSAYGEITTFEYYHNTEVFRDMCDKHGYKSENINDSFLVRSVLI